MLRQALHEMAALSPCDQLARLEALRQEHGHTIEALSAVGDDLAYNCVMFALRVHDDADVYRVCALLTWGPDKALDISMDTGFVRALERRGLIVDVPPEEADLLIYQHEGTITHIGRLLPSGRVQSKWGTNHLYVHDALDVPIIYGSDLRRVTGPEPDVVYEEFITYARSKGAHFEEDGEAA